MNTNFLFNRFLQLTGLSKKKDIVISIFKIGGFECSESQITKWSKINPENRGFTVMSDQAFTAFIGGLLGYIRIQKSLGINVFNFERDFIDDVISMFFDYRKELAEDGINLFNFNEVLDKRRSKF